MNPANTSQDALTQLQQTQAGAKSASDILSGANQQYGVQGAQDTVSGLRGAITNTTKLLNNVAPSVMGRTGNSLVTSAQANRQIQNEQAPISQTLGQQTQDYNTANQDYDKALQQATQSANMQYTDQQNKTSYMQNLYNTLFGREQAAQQAAQAKAAQDEQARQFNEQLAASKASAAAKSSSGTGNYDLSSLLGGGNSAGSNQVSVSSLFNGYNPSIDKNYTEKIVIPTLVSQGYSQAQAAKAAYDYRKSKFGE